jgi:hypothetical protein
MKPRTIFKILLVVCSLAALVYCACVATSRSAFERAQKAHHAEPPLGRTALRQYSAAIEEDPTPETLFEMATLLDHGVLQGPEPVVPNPEMAMGYYRQVAVLGSARNQALARERLFDLGDRVFVNPPPRRQVVAPVVPELPRRTAADVLENVNQQPRSDSQNVHDSSVVKAVKLALDRMGPSALSLETTLVDVRRALSDDEDALRGLDLMERNTVPLTALKMTEVEILRKVWGRIQAEADPASRENMQDMLKIRLKESGQEASCASGRVARVVDSLSTFDNGVKLRPLWALRQEMLGTASVLRGQTNPDDATAIPLIARLRDEFTKVYVDTGLMTPDVLEAELSSWGTDLD